MSSIAESLSHDGWIDQLFQQRGLHVMGHAQRRGDRNLGLGWLYYALGRVLRTPRAVVIGSFRGFVPLVMARALADNVEGGQVHFIDPSMVDDFWKEPSAVQNYFSRLGGDNITHHRMTTQQFVESETYRELDDIGMVFIDGFHSGEQARFDFEAFADKLAPQGMILLHDSIWHLPSRLYGPGREYVHSVADFIAEIKQLPEWQVFDLPFGDGLTLVSRAAMPPPPRRGRKETNS
ncbi:MAG TPA: class I SAM-dependent methyltransferase [Pirellulales bacterium]